MKTKAEKLQELLRELNGNHCTMIDLPYYVNEDIESFDDLYNAIDDGGGFNIEVIYYSRAMEYLMEHDTSLRVSLELADEFGMELSNLSSETLASLHATRQQQEEFMELEDDINAFFEEWEEENEEE